MNCDHQVGIRPSETQITAHRTHLAQWLTQLSLAVVNLDLMELRVNRWGTTTFRQQPDVLSGVDSKICSYPSLKRFFDDIGLAIFA